MVQLRSLWRNQYKCTYCQNPFDIIGCRKICNYCKIVVEEFKIILTCGNFVLENRYANTHKIYVYNNSQLLWILSKEEFCQLKNFQELEKYLNKRYGLQNFI